MSELGEKLEKIRRNNDFSKQVEKAEKNYYGNKYLATVFEVGARIDDLDMRLKNIEELLWKALKIDTSESVSLKKDMKFDEDTLPPELKYKKPCPFCGSSEIEFDKCELYHNGHTRVTIACRNCGANFDMICNPGYKHFDKVKDKLINAWNKRND